MGNGRDFPKRKHPRLNHYDYGAAGAYFITICTQDRQPVLSRIVKRGLAPAGTEPAAPVGRWLAPAEQPPLENDGGSKPPPYRLNDRRAIEPTASVWRLAPAEIATIETVGVEHTPFGEIANAQLFLLEDRYPHLTVDHFVIMPDHIHAILTLTSDPAGASPRPTITDIVCAYKSLTTRECKKNGFEGKLFQTSFYEHIIRDDADYEAIVKYIYGNPMRWYCKATRQG